MGKFHAKIGTIKDRNYKNIAEAEIKRGGKNTQKNHTFWSVKSSALGSITMKKTSRGDGILPELFQILKDDGVKVLNSVCQHIWKTQQWPQDWE